jgi:hypothetical protein
MRSSTLLLVSVTMFGLGCRQSEAPATSALDYDQMVFLDAETLAEGGIGKKYESLRPKLQQYVPQPATITEDNDGKGDRYAVRFREREFVIYAPGLDSSQGQSWGRASHAFFTIVNDQLAGSTHRLYAIGGGNDLGGVFLTPDEAEAAKKKLPRKNDWPYLPTNEHPFYGQYHD